MMIMDGFIGDDYCVVMVNCDDRYWVYYWVGLLCCVCGIEIVFEEIGVCKFYWCLCC